MTNNVLLNWLLLPVSLLYWLITAARNWMFDSGFMKASKFSVPVISIGNLSVGGTGKTPHSIHLIRNLAPHIHVASISRGYKRKTRGFRMVNYMDSAQNVGDEPLLMKKKFPLTPVAVAEDRSIGIPYLIGHAPDTQLVVMDDGFQHRSVAPYINILLTTYDAPFSNDFILPTGRLRESKAGAARADIILVTKCPEDLSRADANAMAEKLANEGQKVFFTTYAYGQPYYLYNSLYKLNFQRDIDVLSFSAIAKSSQMNDYLGKQVEQVYEIDFPDHHSFSKRDIAQVILAYQNMTNKKKVLISTEKDATRLLAFRQEFMDAKIPLFILPIEVKFLFNQEDEYLGLIKEGLLEFQVITSK